MDLIIPCFDPALIARSGQCFRMCEGKGGAVTALIKQDEVQRQTSAAVVERTFGGSLPRFVAAFLNEKPISESEAAQIRALLDAAQRREEDP